MRLSYLHTAEVIAAGNFMDGAITSSTVYLFNHLAHSTSRPAREQRRLIRQLKRILKYGEQNGGAIDISQQGLEFIAGFEGFEPNVYNDVAGIPTILLNNLSLVADIPNSFFIT